jgi:hypothetical protein
VEIACGIGKDDELEFEDFDDDSYDLGDRLACGKVVGFDFILDSGADPRDVFFGPVNVVIIGDGEGRREFTYEEFVNEYDSDYPDAKQVFYDTIRDRCGLDHSNELTALSGTLADAAEEHFRECNEIPEHIDQYIDWEKVQKDYEPSHVEYEGVIYLYDER